jgi:uncharacterized membrane protein
MRANTPWWFWLVSGIALIWNLMGVGAYLKDTRLSDADIIATYGEVVGQAALAQPAWVTAAYALAVFGGALGCLMLLLRKRIAIWPLIISLLAVIAQQGYLWIASGVMAHIPTSSMIMYISIPLVAIFLVWFAKKMAVEQIIH